MYIIYICVLRNSLFDYHLGLNTFLIFFLRDIDVY